MQHNCNKPLPWDFLVLFWLLLEKVIFSNRLGSCCNRVVSYCNRVVSCCTRVVACCSRVVSCCLVWPCVVLLLCRVVSSVVFWTRSYFLAYNLTIKRKALLLTKQKVEVNLCSVIAGFKTIHLEVIFKKDLKISFRAYNFIVKRITRSSNIVCKIRHVFYCH